jgi:prepilin-type N-terminal cleavage/methylation domain-containing protein
MNDRRAFTLLEVLVAAALTAVLAALMLGILTQVLASWGRLSGRLSTAAQAGAILDQLESDLEAALLRADDNVWFAATVQHDQAGAGDAGMSGVDWAANTKPRGAMSLAIAPPDGRLESARFGQAGVWLRFFTTQPDSNASASNRSAPRAVAYQLVRRRVGDRFAYQLFRSQVRPGDGVSTFSEGYDLFSPAYTTPNGSAQHPGNVRRPNATFLLGNHVVDFGVRVFVPDGAGADVLAFPVANEPGQTFAATTRAGATPPGYEGRPVVRGFPVAVEAMVRLLDDETAQRIWNLESGRSPPLPGLTRDETWWHLVDTHGYVAVRRIAVRTQRR